MGPNESADQEAKQRRKKIQDIAFFGADVVADQCGDVDAHEGQQGAEVEQVRALIVSDDEGACERDDADEDDVVAGNPAFGIDRAEELFGNPVAAAHAVQQTRGTELRAHAGADISDQNGEIDQLKQKVAAGGLGDEGKSGGDFILREGLVLPHELRGVDFKRGQHAGYEADQHGSEHDVAARIFDFLGKGGDGVKADVGEHRDRGAVENAFETEGGGIVERMGEKSGAVFVHVPEEPDHEDEKNHDDDAHARRHHFVDASGSLDAAYVEEREGSGVENHQRPVRKERKNILGQLAADDGADQRVEDVVHHDGPAGDVAERGFQFLADVSVGRTGGRIGAGHFAVADRGEEHGDHGDQNGGDHVAASVVADDAVNAHGGDGLNDDDADDDEVEEAEDAAQFYGSAGWRIAGTAHSVTTALVRFRGESTLWPFKMAK